ncbi:hypothetical protein PV327_007466 [Microctonus hyperodae]|uniref:Uncharacterized protein n=1 Tax=Microctonus hyperodae TaxID=165561 RepID=A0AA39FZJ9_MICHY|nr:hypothetical protein PV327_007466 [Microctonus hyperodae]
MRNNREVNENLLEINSIEEKNLSTIDELNIKKNIPTTLLIIPTSSYNSSDLNEYSKKWQLRSASNLEITTSKYIVAIPTYGEQLNDRFNNRISANQHQHLRLSLGMAVPPHLRLQSNKIIKVCSSTIRLLLLRLHFNLQQIFAYTVYILSELYRFSM